MNQKFLKKIREWAFSGRRCVDIKFDSQTGTNEQKIWCYDYDIGEGAMATSIDDIPTINQLKEKKRESAQAMLDSL